MLSRSWLVRCSFSAALVIAAQAQASKLDREVTFHIQPQSLESALLQFSRQADLQFAFASDLTLDLPVKGVDGKLPVEAALTILLRGSGLTYTVVGNNTVTVTRSPTSSSFNIYYADPEASAQRGGRSK